MQAEGTAQLLLYCFPLVQRHGFSPWRMLLVARDPTNHISVSNINNVNNINSANLLNNFMPRLSFFS